MQVDTFGGYHALATYALLASGESPNDSADQVRRRISSGHADMVGIYAIAMPLPGLAADPTQLRRR